MSHSDFSQIDHATVTDPIIFISKGGGGSRLLSTLASDLGIFLGSKLNSSGDSIEMVAPIYRGVIRAFSESLTNERKNIAIDLKINSHFMRLNGGSPARWGFKLPESIYLISYLHQAFPGARYIEMIRDPLATCLRRTHLTARLDNEIGRVTLPVAYTAAGAPVNEIFKDCESVHMAYTTIHQLDIARKSFTSISPEQVYRIRFEDLIIDPHSQLKKLSSWLDIPIQSNKISSQIDAKRAEKRLSRFSGDEIKKVTALLRETRIAHGYITFQSSY